MTTRAQTRTPRSVVRSSRRAARVPLYALLVVLVIFGFFPVYWALLTSLSRREDIFTFPPKLLLRPITFEHYSGFFASGELLRYLVNSLLIATLTAVASLVIGFCAAYSLSKFRYTGRKGLMFALSTAQMVPGVILVISLYTLFNTVNMLNTYAALILSFTTFTLPLCVFLLKSFLDTVPTDIIEAGKVDGASHFAIMIRLVVPLARPGLIAAGMFAFIRGWNDFVFAITLVNPDKQTLPPGMVSTYTGSYASNWGDMMAASLITSLPVIIAFMAMQKHFVSGLTAGSVRG